MIYITIGQFCWGRADGPEQSLAYAVREFNPRYCADDKATFVTYECEDDGAVVNDQNEIIAMTDSEINKVCARIIPKTHITAYRKAIHDLFWGSEVLPGVEVSEVYEAAGGSRPPSLEKT